MSDIARQYAPALQPGLIAGTTASYAAGAGTVKLPGISEASVKNADNGHDYKTDLARL